MKFRKEDAGLYFASSLVGAGIGLLIGAFIASRRARIVIIEEELEGPVFESAQEERSFYRMTHEPKAEEFELEEDESVYSAELLNFIEEVRPSAIQIELIHKGVVTMADVRNAVKETDELLEPYAYSSKYQLEIEDNKPDLADITQLPEDLGLIDERFKLSATLPKGRSVKKVRTIFYDAEDDTFVQTRGDRLVPLHSLDGILTTTTWELVLDYLLGNLTPIFALDTSTEKLYSFDLVPAKEDSDDMVADDLK